MACYHPWTHTAGGASRLLSCGQCIGCRLEKSRQWATRCVHETKLWPENSSITLTYNNENIPQHKNLNYKDYQLFMKRLRKHYPDKTIRFYMSGEYGEQDGRPHYHAILFNHDFQDKIHYTKTPQGHILYTSPTLEKLWTKGYSTIGEANFETAAYVARYIMKKITGEQAKKYYEITLETGEIINKKQEFNNMSRRPGIGQNWLKKYKKDIYPTGTLIINAHKARPPRYYDQQYKKTNPRQYANMIAKRAQEALTKINDNNDQRLHAKQTVKQAQLEQLKRKI